MNKYADFLSSIFLSCKCFEVKSKTLSYNSEEKP